MNLKKLMEQVALLMRKGIFVPKCVKNDKTCGGNCDCVLVRTYICSSCGYEPSMNPYLHGAYCSLRKPLTEIARILGIKYSEQL